MPIKEEKSVKNSATNSLEDLIRRNLELTEELKGKIEKIHRYVIWQRTFSIIKILIILVPLILGIIYLPPLLKEIIAPYQDLMGGLENINTTIDVGGFDIKSLLNSNDVSRPSF